jgi:hypothetical protein
MVTAAPTTATAPITPTAPTGIGTGTTMRGTKTEILGLLFRFFFNNLQSFSDEEHILATLRCVLMSADAISLCLWVIATCTRLHQIWILLPMDTTRTQDLANRMYEDYCKL